MWQPREGAILDRLLQAYEARGNVEIRARARAGALAFDADKIAQEHWKPVLEDIEQTLRAEGKIGVINKRRMAGIAEAEVRQPA
jgi:hypothetical protein